ncbi:uncharacterized protein [Macrobrachium rosenbergii]|uniref:uncharacterized protein isoform X2 n=1 Tax=Macrobrachium rosenbergii TaxID=79674 RepID=UPI0034D4D698
MSIRMRVNSDHHLLLPHHHHVGDRILLQCLATLLLVSAVVAGPQVVEEDDQSGLEESPLTVVQAVESGRVLLPCDVSAPEPTDDTILVLFYQGPIGTPIYSIDGRNGPINRAPHWADENTLGSRAYFDMASEPPGLVLQSVKESDDNEYRCRVDFRSSPTRNVRIELDVIVPLKKIKILSEAGLEVSGVIGPYPVGASVKLQCQVDSGRPRPSVSWFHEGSLLDDVSEVRRGDVTSNTLTIPALTRNDLYKVLTCQASNSNLSVPVAAAVTLDMSFPPLDARILGSLDSLAEGERYEIVCESSGSRPTATITWWKGGILMTDTRSQVFQEGNVSRSTLYLTPSLADHDVYVFCRAKNPMVPSAVMEDSRKLNVHYTPRLSLAAGVSLDMDDIKEGDDVYFECGINANPKVIKVQWYHNGEELIHNVTAGVIQSNQSLVLQRVNRRSSGQYTCSATNVHGHGKSNAVQLSVKFAPVCRPGQKIIYGGGKHEELNVTCNVEAHPEPNYFRWAFNSSSEVVDIPSSSFKVIGKGRSQASYTPKTHLDYGTLLCWANNEVGRQLTPCIFHVIHASAPDPVNNCTVDNVTSSGASVRCQAGWDGGMEQTFMLRVSHARAHTRAHDKKKEAPRVLANTSTSPKPEFLLTGLEPGTEYVLTIMGVNKKGQSDAMRMAIVTLKDVAEKRTSPGSGTIALTPILAVLFGVLASILLMVIVIVIVVRSRQPRPRKPEVKMLYDKGGSPATLPLRRHDEPSAVDDHNPDVIPINDDHQVKELQQDYVTETTGLPQGSGGPSFDHVRQGSPSQTSPQQTSSKKEYLQGHEGSFYINPGTLLRQKGALPPRDADSLLLMGCPLAASTPTTTTTRNSTTTPTVSENFDRQESERNSRESPARETVISTSPWLPQGSRRIQRQRSRRPSQKSLLSVTGSPSSSSIGVQRSDSNRSVTNRPTVHRSESNRSVTNRPTVQRSESNRSVTNRPVVHRSESNRSMTNRPTVHRSESNRSVNIIKPAVHRSESNRSVNTIKPTVHRSESNRSVNTIKPTVQRSESNRSMTNRPVVHRSESNRSVTTSATVHRSESTSRPNNIQRSSSKRPQKPKLRVDTSTCSWSSSQETRKLEKRRSLEAEDVTSPWLLNAPIVKEEWRFKETLVATSPWLQEHQRSGSLKSREIEEGIAPWPPLVTKQAEKVRIVCPLDAKVRIELRL